MSGKRTALLIVTDTYADQAFSKLAAPAADADALAAVLSDPDIGGYAVDVLANRPSHEVRKQLNQVFSEAERDDLVLVYVSGHAVKDESGRLHMATADTERKLLAATAVSAEFVRELIDQSRSRKVVVWLDCCYSGAFPAGRSAKAEGSVDVLAQLSGSGCAVMTASTSIQFAFEDGASSVFTDAIVRGLSTGDADLNADGVIDAAELYSYVYAQVKASTPEQTPTRNDQVTGELYIALGKRGPRRDLGSPAPKPGDAGKVSEISHDLAAPAVFEIVDNIGTLVLGVLGFWLAFEIGSTVSSPPPAYLVPLIGVVLLIVSSQLIPKHWERLTVTADGLRVFAKRRRADLAWAHIAKVTLADVPGKGSRLDVRLANFVSMSVVNSRPLAGAVRDGTWTLGEISASIDSLAPAIRRIAPSSVTVSRRNTVAGRYRGMPLVGVVIWALLLAGSATSVHMYRYAHRNDPVVLDTGTSEITAEAAANGVVAVACGDNSIQLWNVRSHQKLHTLTGHTGKINKLALSPSGYLLASASEDGTVQLWDAQDGTHTQTLQPSTIGVATLALSPDAETLARVNDDGTIQLWNVLRHRPDVTINAQVDAVMFSDDGKIVETVDANETAHYWNVVDGTNATHGSGQWAARKSNGDVDIIDMKTGEVKQTLSGTSAVQALAFGLGDTTAVGRANGTVELWDTRTPQVTTTLPVAGAATIDALVFDWDGKTLVGGDSNGKLELWSVG